MVARGIWRLLGAIVGIIVIVGLAAFLFVKSGLYNVSAAYPDPAPVAWILGTTMDNSVKRHARGIEAPPLDDPKMIEAGLGHYRQDCMFCHGAPGVKIGEVGRGLNPDPPKLTESAGDWKPNELFWITKNGVRMTGMPAWGKTHKDVHLWHIVAFLRKLPGMTPAQFKDLAQKSPRMKKP